MKEVENSQEVVENQETPKNVTYKVEDINQLMSYLGGQKFSDVAGIINMLKDTAVLS